MRVLLDHCVPKRFGRLIHGHEVATARRMGWDDLKNGRLIATAETDGFDVLVTTDKSLRYQQNLSGRRIAVVTLDALFNDLDSIAPLAPALLRVLGDLTPGAFVVIRPEA